MTEEIENIIKNTEYGSLSKNQRNKIQEFATSKEEYDGLKMVLLTVKSTKKETMQVSKNVKNRLDLLFEETYAVSEEKVGFWTRVGAFLWPKGSLFVKPIVQFASVCLIVVLGYTLVNTTSLNKTEVAALTENKNTDKKVSRKAPKEIKKEIKTEVRKENVEEDVTLSNENEVETSNPAQIKPSPIITTDELTFDISEKKSNTSVNSKLLDANHPDLMLDHVTETPVPTMIGNANQIAEDMYLNAEVLAKPEPEVKLYSKANENNNAVLDLLTPLF